jgi:anti-sigma-K factor RskA
LNIREYIESGVLEQYVLGLASPKEQSEVERYADEFPEVREELRRLQRTMEDYATAHAVEPPAAVRGRVLDSIKSPEGGIPPRGTGGSNRGWLWLLSLLLIATIVGLGITWSGLRDSDRAFDMLQADYDALQADCDTTRAERALARAQLEALRDVQTTTVQLSGLPIAPESQVTVFWNPGRQETYLDVINLPTPPSDRQYQLWAIVDGNPVDMGVITLDPGQDTLTPVPFVDNPAAFAITLEPLGGSENPTLDQMYVIGNVTG